MINILKEIMEAFNLVCFKCKHMENWDGFGCEAFPNGIPDEIVSGHNKHTKPLPDQGNNIVFEPIENTDES